MSANVFELVCFNRYRQARLVLEAGGDPNFRNERQETPLMACAMFIREPDRRTQLMRMLIGFGADINAQNDKGQTVLMYACILNQIDSVLVLIDQEQIDLNLGDITGNTILMYACALDRGSIVYVLLELYRTRQRVINIYQRNHTGLTAREISEQKGFENINELFIETMDKDYWSSYYELSQDMATANQSAYPLKIEGNDAVQDFENGAESQLNGVDPSNPLASMVEHVLQISNGPPGEYGESGAALNEFSRQDSIGGSSLNTMTSHDGLADSADVEPESSRKYGGTSGSEEHGSILRRSVDNEEGDSQQHRTKVSRRKSMKSRQSGKSRSSTESQPDDGSERGEVRLSRQGSFRRSKSSKHRVPIAHQSSKSEHGTEDPHTESLDTRATPAQITERSPASNHSPTRAPPGQRINYYTRHDIPGYEANPNATSVDLDSAEVTHPRPPRPPSRSGSRMRRRKTTEVCVTVSDGKIVPYYPDKKKSHDVARNAVQDDFQGPLHYDGNNNNTSLHHGGTRQSRRESTYDESPRLSVRSKQRRENRLARPTDVGNSAEFDRSYPIASSRSHGATSGFDPESYNYNDRYHPDLVNAWASRNRQDYGQSENEVNYDLLSGRPQGFSNGSATSRDSIYDNHYGRSSSRNAPRRSGSFRAVAW